MLSIISKFKSIILIFEVAFNYIIKEDPCPKPSLFTLTIPPIFSIMVLQILRPRPVPYLFISLVSANLLKLWKSLLRFSYAIPTPLSLITISNDM